MHRGTQRLNQRFPNYSLRSSLIFQAQEQQSHKDAATDKAHEARDKISQSVQNAKEKVNPYWVKK